MAKGGNHSFGRLIAQLVLLCKQDELGKVDQ
jgi:hypothetical protein